MADSRGAEARDATRDLIDGWRDLGGALEMGHRGDARQGLVVFGLVAHAVNLADAALLLDDNGRHAECAALVRQLIECAWTAAWVERYGTTATEALWHENARARLITVNSFATAGFSATKEELASLKDAVDAFSQSASPPGRTFQARCEDLEGGAAVYAVYRAISAYTHAGTPTVDLYLTEVAKSEASPLGLGISRIPKPDHALIWFDLVPGILGHALLAWSRFDRTHGNRTLLRQLAQRVDVTEPLAPTATGLKRERARKVSAKAARRQRRSSGTAGR